MKKGLLVSLFVGVMLLSWSSLGWAAYSIDGYLSDWGVNPFFDWEPSGSNVDYVEEDWGGYHPYPGYIGHGGMPLGGESYDIEAMYFDDDPEYIYFAMVTSQPFSRSGSGDIAISFGSGGYDYGIKLRGLDTYGSGTATIRQGDNWVSGYGFGSEPVYMDGSTGTDIGLAEIHYWNATYGSGPYNEPGTGTHTWVLEARMNRTLFNGLNQQGDHMNFYNTMDCYNDMLYLSGDFDSPVIPEPTTLALLGISLASLLGFRRRFV